MVVKIEEIQENGLELDEPIELELVTRALGVEKEGTGFRATDVSRLKASFRKISGSVLLEAAFKASLTAPCKRCLADVICGLPVRFTLNLIPRDLTEAGKESDDDETAEEFGSFELDDADQEVFDGKSIDLDPILREQVLLALPMDVVCREDCKGLCPVCGENRNQKTCGCEPKGIDPRLMALKNIKLN